MPKILLAESTDDWRASPKTASELVSNPTKNLTTTTTRLARKIPPSTRRTPDDFSRESATLGMVEVGSRGEECQRSCEVASRQPPVARRSSLVAAGYTD